MIKQLSIILTLSLASTTVMAETQRANYQNPASTEEAAGFFSGAVMGAVAGGPPGAIVGAAIGALTGDGFRARREVNDMRADLYAAQLETARMREQSGALEQEYELALAELERLRGTQPTTMPAYLPAGESNIRFDNTSLTVHFRSGSDTIESQYREQLQSLAQLAGQFSTAAIEITGYADRNGDAQKNLQLSRQRSTVIADYFKQQGVDNASITTVSYGDTRPAHQARSFETDFFDRRVIVRLRDNSQQMLSHSQDGE